MEYRYKALYENQILEGVVEAEDKWEAVSKLKSQGMTIIQLEELSVRDSKVNYKFLETFTRQLYQLIKSGLTTDRAMAFLSKSEKKYSQQLTNVLNDLRSGSSFSNALRNSGIFPKSYIEMIKSGEESGNLEEILELLIDALSERNELRRSIINAIIYPSFLLSISLFSFMMISMYVVPKFKTVLQTVDIELPFITKLAFFISDVFSYIIIALLFLVLSVLFTLRFLIRKRKETIENLVLRIPFFGSMVLKVELIRFSQSIYSLLRSNLPLNVALDISVETVSLLSIKKRLQDVKREVLRGAALSQAIRKHKLFPAVFVEIVSVGEQSGELAGAFYRIYTQFNEELKDNIRRFISLLEPSIIVLMGLIVGFLVFSMMLAVFSISSGV
ncbi:MAG: type II secretion system F family protein [Aquificaceae bacterium]|nr:type II secretion system F family protein [Aquificaceae bacterium]MDW8422921.1 type II secretion system F family protein [Aquificaceae bacterium]